MKQPLLAPLLLLVMATAVTTANIHAVSPDELQSLFPQPIKAHISPIGYRPLSGRLEGSLLPADPSGACSKLSSMESENEDFFVLADDTECLESVKAGNIALSGGYAGIVRQNLNNTLQDKEISRVHIPILEISPIDYDMLSAFLQENKQSPITLSIDFTDQSQTHPINVQFWFSPTELSSYQFLLNSKEFLTEQTDLVSFAPHYVLQSQQQSNNFIGCLSSGRYCPSEIEFQGKYEGANIVEETLKQIIIWDLEPSKWWNYIEKFSNNCLRNNNDIFMNTSQLHHCHQNSLIMAGVSQVTLNQEFNNSFLGNRKQADDNTYLLQERQLLTREQVKTHPALLINKKSQEVSMDILFERVCKMEGESASSFCIQIKEPLSLGQTAIIVAVILGLFVAIAALYRLYMHIRMRREIKSEVDKTLEQYYRYIQTFEEDGKLKSKGMKQYKSKILDEDLEEVPQMNQEVFRAESVEMKPVGLKQ